MRIFQLTPIGVSAAANPTQEMTDGMRVIYFLKRHGGRASDDQVAMYTGIDRVALNGIMRKLTTGTNPPVMVIAG